jgi:hypothetical protein
MATNLSSEETASVAQGAILESTTQQNISQAQQVRLASASDVLLRNATRNSTGSPTLKDLTATNVYYKPDGSLVIVTQSGQEYTASKDDEEFFKEKTNENTLIVREQNNEIETFKAWAQEQGVYKLGQTDTITSIAQLQRDPYYKDFQSYSALVEQRTGAKPYGTPYQNYLITKTLQDTTLEDTPKTKYPQASVVDPFVDYGRRPAGSAALASDELAALKRAVGSDSNQQKVNQSLGLVEVPQNNFARQTSALYAQRAADAWRYGSKPIGLDDDSGPPAVSASSFEGQTDEFGGIDELIAANQLDGTDTNPASPRKVAVRPNPLDAYTSHSYTISLHILTLEEYNAMVSTDRSQSFSPTKTLIAGAGARGDGVAMPRVKGWEDNFFFESLKLSSVVGLNSTSRGTNVIECEFTIVEPYGLSLVDRLTVTTDELSQPGLYFANCYLLEINFYSADDGKLSDMKKFIPIRLTGMTIKASAKGSEYRCTAIPFSHHALTQTRASTPANFTVNAGTLEEFFQGEDSLSSRVAEQGAREVAELSRIANGDQAFTTQKQREKAQADIATAGSKNFEIKSYVAAYNEWQSTLVRLKALEVKKPNKISVVFDKKFTENNGNKVNRQRHEIGTVGSSPMATGNDPKNGDNVRANQVQDNFTFAAGTQITEVINVAMQSSDFIRNQIVLQNEAKAVGKIEVQGKVTWWKIIPSVTLQDFDNKNNQWSFDTTYYVVPYELWNTTHPSLPKAVPSRDLCSKEYLYYYTGENTSVIDFAIDFDFMYFTKVVATKEKNESNSYGKQDDQPETVSGGATKKGIGVNPGVITYVSDDPTTAGKRARDDAKAMAVANAAESIYSSAAGEMLNITLKIIGDPELIKQDDVFTGVSATLGQTPAQAGDTTATAGTALATAPEDLTKKNNNSLVMDNSEIVCWVEIKTPVDIDDNTGGVRFFENNKVKSGFTGVYKLLIVDSEFSRGQFTQTLDLIRYMNQDFRPPDDREELADAVDPSRRAITDYIKKAPTDDDSSEVKVSNEVKVTEEPDLQQTKEVIINKIAPLSNFTKTSIPGGNLIQYTTTVP